MQVGFFCQRATDLPMAKLLVESVKRVMPGVSVYHLTDGKCPSPSFATSLRIEEDMPMGVRRLTHYARQRGDWVFVDTDVVFNKGVEDVFSKPFDIAMADRKGTLWENSDYARVMPHNFGVVFSRNFQFWVQALRYLKTMPANFQEWEGEQLVTNELARTGPFQFEVLPSSYNFTPATKDEDVSDKHVLHYKGNRKAWILGS